MSGTPSRSHAAQLAIDSAALSGTSPGFEFVSCGLKRTDTFVQGEGIRGTRSRHSSRVRLAQKQIGGPIVMNPTPTELDLLWPWILGGTTSSGVTAVAETLPTRNVGVLKVQRMFTYDGCVVSRAVLSGQAGQPVQLTLEVEGTDEVDAAAGSWPAITYPTDNMFVFADLDLTINSVAYYFGQFTLTIDNVVQADRYLNNLTRDKLTPLDRVVTLELQLPYDTINKDLYALAIAGFDAELAMSDGTTTYTFAFANVKAPAVGPDIQSRASEIGFGLTLQSFFDGTDREIKVTKS